MLIQTHHNNRTMYKTQIKYYATYHVRSIIKKSKRIFAVIYRMKRKCLTFAVCCTSYKLLNYTV